MVIKKFLEQMKGEQGQSQPILLNFNPYVPIAIKSIAKIDLRTKPVRVKQAYEIQDHITRERYIA
jgi:hypothetical protein